MAAESYIENTQERYEKALAAEASRIEKLKAEQRIVDGLKQTAWALVDVAAIGLAIMSGGTLAPISVAILTFSAAEITEGAGNIYLGITGNGSSIAFNPIRDILFMGNQDVYNVASFAVNIADMKLSKPKVSSLDDIARFGAKSAETKGINRVKDLTKKLLGKVDDVGDVKKGGKGVSAVDEAVEAVGKGSKKTVCKSGTKTVDVNGKTVTMNNSTFDPNFVDKQGRTNIQRMEQGLAPIGTDGKSVNIHHIDQTNNGPVMEITATEHQQNYSILHINIGQSPSQINRSAFNNWRRGYWEWRSNNLD